MGARPGGELLDLGTVGPSYGRFEAPHSSDWALAVGDFE